jgi:phosphoribosylformylglycinamidine synthase PurS subunit
MPKFEATVHTMRKAACLKPEEPVVLRALHEMGFNGVTGIKIGTCNIISLEADDETTARTMITEMSEKLLINPVTDTFVIAQIKEK